MRPDVDEIMPWETVAYAAVFLRSTMQGGLCNWRGRVISKECDPLWLVQWSHETEPRYVNKHNIVSVTARGGLQADAERSPVWGLNEKSSRFSI